MTREQLIQNIFSKKSYLCVGLDTDINKIPAWLGSDADGIFRFNRKIIDDTKDYCVAYKINTAFYEAMGSAGWDAMERTVNYIPGSHFKIADAKRGDIGNTSTQYAKAFFETLNFDAITVSPYMGEDSIRPFLEYNDKWTIVLGLTSNPGASDFELKKIVQPPNNIYLYESVLETVSRWGTINNLMFVVGATRSDELINIRKIVPKHFLLVPGIGSQGGNLEDVSKSAMIKDCGLLVNISRTIIYAGDGQNFAEEAGSKALQFQKDMSKMLIR